MKTIILCGGKGTRLREETEFKPKPMVMVGDKPMVLHIMNIYAAFDYKEFYLCLGYKGNMIREYFLHLDRFANDVAINLASGVVDVIQRRIEYDYRVALIETGEDTESGGRIKMAAGLFDDRRFMVTYGDGVSDVDLHELVQFHERQLERHGTLVTVTAAHPSSKFGQVIGDRRNVLTSFSEKPRLHDYINGGFMVFERKALRYLRAGESLEEGLERLTKIRKVSQYKHEGFWYGMDTMKDVQHLNELWATTRPWAVRSYRQLESAG